MREQDALRSEFWDTVKQYQDSDDAMQNVGKVLEDIVSLAVVYRAFMESENAGNILAKLPRKVE